MILDFKVLKHQREFIESNSNTILVAGYGAGKSHTGTYKTIFKKLQYPTKKVAYYLPTYPLIKDIAFDKFPNILDQLQLKYKLNKSDKEISIENYGSILFRSMDTPETIIGYETAYSLIDEADVLPMDKMDKVYKKILGRNRAVLNGNIDVISTPEGHKWLYNATLSGHFNVIRAKTTDNKYLPPDYIQSLVDQYPEQLLKAYLNGEFVNLTQGTVYSSFKRDIHNTDLTVKDSNSLIIGQDFNIGSCCSVVYIRNGQGLFAVDEYASNDTFEIINNTLNRYPNLSANQIEFFPDASGYAGKTNASKSDIQMLKDAGFKINAPSKNGRVMDRVNSTNNAFEKGLLKVNTKTCPNFTKALEQQAWTVNNEPEKFNGAGTVDDWNDAGTYPVVRILGINRPIAAKQKLSFA